MMSEKITRNEQQSTNLLQTLILFLQSLGYRISSYEQLLNGIIIAEFVSTIQGIDLNPSEILMHGQDMTKSNFMLINSKIMQIMGKNWTQADISEITTNYNMDQLLKLIKSLFILSTRSQNSNYFIQKILTLPIQSQLLLAQLIKQDKYFRLSPSPSRQYDNQTASLHTEKEEVPKQDLHFKHKFSIIDKMYELEVENQRLMGEVKKVNGENGELKEHVAGLCARIQQLRIQCEQLRKQLTDTTQSLSRLSNSQPQPQPPQPQNPQLLQILSTYRNKFHQLSIQSQSTIIRYQQEIQYYKTQLQRQNSHKKSLKEQLQYCHKQFEGLIRNIEENQREIQEMDKKLMEKDVEIRVLREKELSFKFQIGYRDSRIQELRGIVGLGDNSDTESVCSYTDNNETNMRKSFMRSSKMLASQFPQPTPNTSSTPHLRQSLQIPESLRKELKYLRKELQKTNIYKSKIQQLQYQKNRLLKILSEYENNRGEQNQILMGCLYQMHSHYVNTNTNMNMSMNVNSNSCLGNSKGSAAKVNVSRSTLDQGGFEKDKNWIEGM